jgi:hypothetical protein
VDGVHLLLGYVALLVGLIHLGAPEDHEVELGLGELGVLLGVVCPFAGLPGRLLGHALLAKDATNVAPDGGVVLEEVLCLPPVEQAGALKCLLKVIGVRTPPTGLKLGGAVGRDHCRRSLTSIIKHQHYLHICLTTSLNIGIGV